MAGVSSSSSCVDVATVTGVVVVVTATAVVVRGALLVAGLAAGRFCAVVDRGGDAAGSAPCDCADFPLGVSVVVLKSHWKRVGSCFKLVVPAGAPGKAAVFGAEKAESAAPPTWGSADEEAPDR